MRRLGGMLTSPRATLRAIAAEGAPAWPPLVLLLAATALVEAKVLVRLAFLLGEGGTVILRRMRDTFVDDLRTDAALLAGTCVVLAILARVLTKGRVSPVHAAVAGAYLLVPLVVLKCLGGALAGFGLDLWWMPHTAVDSMSVVVGREVSWLRFAVKCATAYTIPLAFALTLVASFRARGGVAALDVVAGRARLAGGAGIAGAFVLLTAAAGVSTVRYFDRIRPTLPGDPLPDIKLHRFDEFGVSRDALRLSSLRGKVVVLDFWASWCSPCRRSMPELSKINDDLKDRGLVIVGVNRDVGDPAAGRKALREIQPSFEGVVDDRMYAERLGITTLPTSYIVDQEGIVREMHLGYTEPDIVRGEIETLLTR